MDKFQYRKGSVWRKWDLQSQTILDDDYKSLEQYYQEIKTGKVIGVMKQPGSHID